MPKRPQGPSDQAPPSKLPSRPITRSRSDQSSTPDQPNPAPSPVISSIQQEDSSSSSTIMEPMNTSSDQAPTAGSSQQAENLPRTEAQQVESIISDFIRSVTVDAHESLVQYVQAIRDNSDMFQYTGLNVLNMRTRIASYAMYNGSVRVDSSEALKLLSKAIALGVTRGNNLVNMVKHMSEAGKVSVSEIVSRLHVKSKIDASDAEPTITLSRMQACFPELTARVCAIINPRLISFKTPTNYPKSMRNSAFAAMIPKENKPEFVKLRQAYTMYQAQVSIQLGKKSSDNVNKKLLTKQNQYTSVSYQFSVVGEPAKMKVINDEEYEIMVGPPNAKVLNPALVELSKEYRRIMNMDEEED